MNMDHSQYIDAILRAYRAGASGDFLQMRVGENWAHFWTVPSCSPTALEKAGLQFIRCRAEAVRHARRAVLKSRAKSTPVVVVTVLPDKKQEVYCLNAGHRLQVRYLEDAALAALAQVFVAKG